MTETEPLEDHMQEQIRRLEELKTATVFLEHKEALNEQLRQAKMVVDTFQAGITDMKLDLQRMKEQNAFCRDMLECLKKLNAKIIHIGDNLPIDFVREFMQLTESASPCVTERTKEPAEPVVTSEIVDRVRKLTVETPVQDCKKTLFKNVEDSYSIEPLSEQEFSKIPKYIIGRQTLVTLNELVTTINKILESKYSLLALGKVGAKKKGKLDMYLNLRREMDVSPGNENYYFFTEADYLRHTETRLDKMKLNLITALRHCKRLREVRAGKSLRYSIVTSRNS